MADKIRLEDASGSLQLEDASGVLLQEIQPTSGKASSISGQPYISVSTSEGISTSGRC